MFRQLYNTHRELGISLLSAIAMVVAFLFFPINLPLEYVFVVIVFLWLMPLFYVRIVLKKKEKISIFGMDKFVLNAHLVILSIISLCVGTTIAYAFSRLSIASLYRNDIFNPDNVIALLTFNLVLVFLLYLIIVVFSFGFIYFITESLSDKIRNMLAWSFFSVLFFSFMHDIMPNVALWYLLPIVVPVVFALKLYRARVLYIVPISMVTIKLMFDIFIVK